jgi:hypothetical protein
LTLKIRLLLANILALVCFSIVNAQLNQSVYTSLEAKSCRTLKSDSSEAGEYLGRCSGVSGYSILVEEGDLRQNITVVTPKGTKHPLELWTLVSSAFSSLGPKAEWRMTRSKTKAVPIALIVRYNASENSEKPDRTTSYLVVTKITQAEICVIDRIPPGPTANDDARRLADESTSKPCLKSKS